MKNGEVNVELYTRSSVVFCDKYYYINKLFQLGWGLANRTYRSKAISKEVAKFESRETVAKVLQAKGLTSSFAALSWVKYAATIGLGSVLQAKSVRNMAAQSMYMTDTAVNPHFHPFKDKEQFNAHASVESNNKVNSIVFLELVKKTRGKLKCLF